MYQPNKIARLSAILIALPCIAIAGCNEPSTQLEMNMCAQKEFDRNDKDLNLAYQNYRDGLPESQRKLLRNAQISWIKFRDASCAFEASAVDGGSMQPMVYALCLSDYTKKRLERIVALSECKLMPNPGKDCAY